MENKDKEENEQDTRYTERDRHIAVSGHSGMDIVTEPMPVCKHVNSAAGRPRPSFFVFPFCLQPISHHSCR